MKKTLLLASMTLGALASTGQITTYVLQPPALEGALEFTWADNWGQTPDLNDPANSVTAYAMFVNDGDDGTVSDSLACDVLTGGPDMTGMIAVVYRGSCEFGAKAMNAQDAGAAAVVIINNTGGAPIAMGAGAVGGNVTIPVVMITDAAGAMLRDEILAGNVEMLIGSVLGVYEYNMHVNKSLVMIPPFAAIPGPLANASNLSFDLGAMVKNFGSQSQSDVALNCRITKDGTEVYNNTSTASTINNGDSAYFTLPPFTDANYSGYYEGTYTVNAPNEDDFPGDDTFVFNFLADSLFTYGRVDPATRRPVAESHVRAALDVPNFMACAYFTHPNASDYEIEGIYTSGTKSGGVTMDGEVLEARIYEWNDAFTGWSDATTNNIVQIVSADYYYEGDLGGQVVYVPFNEPYALEDDVKYLFCSFSPATDVFLGFGESLDYTRVQAVLDDPIYLMSNDGAWGSFTDASHCSVGAKLSSTIIGIDDIDRLDVTPYPNPASDQIVIPVAGQSGKATLEVFDLAGAKVVERQVSVANNGLLTMDVSDIANGTYLFSMNFENGKHASFRVVVTK